MNSIIAVIMALGLVAPAVALASRLAARSRKAIERAAGAGYGSPSYNIRFPQRLLAHARTKDGGNSAAVGSTPSTWKARQIPCRLSVSTRSRGRPMCVALVTMLSLTLTASAMAWRHPTASERQAIIRAASRTPTSPPHEKVHVSNIRVSTVGPWARATITIYFGKAPDAATDILHKVHGKWVNVGAGTSGEECAMPPKDRQNLGFGPYPCGTT